MIVCTDFQQISRSSIRCDPRHPQPSLLLVCELEHIFAVLRLAHPVACVQYCSVQRLHRDAAGLGAQDVETGPEVGEGEHIEREERTQQARWSTLDTKAKFKEWAMQNQYKIILGSWAASMAVAGTIVMRNRYVIPSPLGKLRC